MEQQQYLRTYTVFEEFDRSNSKNLTGLDLQGNSLSPQVSIELGQLTNLQVLSLTGISRDSEFAWTLGRQ